MGTHKRHVGKIAVIVVLAAVAVALFVFAETRIPADTHSQTEQSIKASIEQAAMQCFAIEGAYPASLVHLENEYNVVVNRNEYIVTYTCFASNLKPQIEVFARNAPDE